VTVWTTITRLGLAVELCTRVVKIGLKVVGDEERLDDPVAVIKAVEGKKIEVNGDGGKERVEELTAKEGEALTAWLPKPSPRDVLELDAPAVPEGARVRAT
jgi:hypothetical protein